MSGISGDGVVAQYSFVEASREPGTMHEPEPPVNNDRVPYSPIDLADKLSLFSEQWSPKTVARLNDYEIKVVKLQGEFTWHSHQDTDELFLVTNGQLTIQMRDGNVTLGPGQLFIVPRGVEHCPVTEGEAHAVLIELTGVVNTGDVGGLLTAAPDDSLA